MRKNHVSTLTLLHVPTHSNLLSDQDNNDKTECRQQLVTSADGWRVEMGKWIGKVREAEEAEKLEEQDTLLQALESHCSTAFKFITINNLFGSTTYKPVHPSRTIEEEEVVAMAEVMEDALVDNRLDDGAIEINSDNEFH